jgi:putative flippase GtrA
LTAAATLDRRFRQLIGEGAAFCVVGGLAFLIVVAGSDLLRYVAGLGKYAAVTIATVVATAFSFTGNRLWTFRHRQGAGAALEAGLFFAFNGVGLLVQYATIGLITGPLGLTDRLWYRIALVLGVGLGTLFRFWAYRKWVWVLPGPGLATARRGRHRKRRIAPGGPPGAAAGEAPAAGLRPAAQPVTAVRPVPAADSPAAQLHAAG